MLLMHVDAAGPDPAAAKTLLRTLDDAERLAHKVSSPLFIKAITQFAKFVHCSALLNVMLHCNHVLACRQLTRLQHSHLLCQRLTLPAGGRC